MILGSRPRLTKKCSSIGKNYFLYKPLSRPKLFSSRSLQIPPQFLLPACAYSSPRLLQTRSYWTYCTSNSPLPKCSEGMIFLCCKSDILCFALFFITAWPILTTLLYESASFNAFVTLWTAWGYDHLESRLSDWPLEPVRALIAIWFAACCYMDEMPGLF